ncbi:cell division protein FtsH, partial [Pseudomonas putida]
MNKDKPWTLYLLAVGLAVLAAVQFGLFSQPAVQAIPYSQFLQLLDQQKVSDLHIEHERILGRLQEPIDGHSVFSTVRVDPALSEQLGRSGVAFSGVVEDNTAATVAGALMPLLMMLVLWYFLFHGLGQKQGLG